MVIGSWFPFLLLSRWDSSTSGDAEFSIGVSFLRGAAFVVLIAFAGCTASEDSPQQKPPPQKSQLQGSPLQNSKAAPSAKMDMTQPPDVAGLASGKVKPPTPEEAQEQLKQQGGDWLYGKGLGSTILTVGTCVVFPPYAIYVLGNAGLSMAGY